MDRLNETIRTYDKDVDRYIHKLEFDLPKEELEKFIGLLKGKKVLDAGCGAGRDSKYLSEKGLDVIGIDLSKNMIKAAKERAKAEFHVGDIRNTNFGDASFNGIWCYNTLLHLDSKDLDMAITEFGRVLTNGGILFIATMKGHSEIAKESKKGTKHFFQYQEEHIQNILVRHSFNTIWTRSYRQRDEEFIDFLFRK